MKTREPLYPEFGISKTLEVFRQPPCTPPCGREILERFLGVFYSQLKNARDKGVAAHTVAVELNDLWLLGDARIPLLTMKTMKKKILELRETLNFLCIKGKKGRPGYADKVSS